MSAKYSQYKSTPTRIPTIQRDYVQGSDANAEKRDAFVRGILTSLLPVNKSSFPIDFIYGSKQQCADGSEEFLPIDGQQRLTTLTLLGWLLSQRVPEENYNVGKMSYKNRITSDMFCQHLLEEKLPSNRPCDFVSVSHYIKTVPMWFAEQWLNDPTICAMLELLDYMDSLLDSPEFNPYICDMANRFFNEDNCPIEFEMLDMDEYKLTEDLYIKMNSRGKELTEFEIFKAEFGKFLKDKFGDVLYQYGKIENNTVTIPQYFEYAVEHQWTDLFWPYALENYQPGEDDRGAYPTIDEYFMRFLLHFTEMLFSEMHDISGESKWMKQRWPERDSNKELPDPLEMFSGKNNRWLKRNIFRTYRYKDNVVELFRHLDIWAALQNSDNNITGFFESLLYIGQVDDGSGRVNIFEISSDPEFNHSDLFRGLLTRPANSGLQTWFRYLLHGITKAKIRYENDKNSLIDFVRIYWGLLQNINQRNNTKITVTFDIALDKAKDVRRIVDNLLGYNKTVNPENPYLRLDKLIESNIYVQQEKKKGKFYATPQFEDLKQLCNHEWTRWSFENILDALSQAMSQNISGGTIANNFMILYQMQNLKRVRKLLTRGFDGMNTKSWNYLYVGPSCWPYMMATKNAGFCQALTDYLLGNGGIQNPIPNKFVYYALKYNDFLPTSSKYLFYRESDFCVWALSGSRRAGYLSDPYSDVVMRHVKAESISKLGVSSSSVDSNHGRLWLENMGLSLECCEDGWEIKGPDYETLLQDVSVLEPRYHYDSNLGKIIDRQNKFSFIGMILNDLPGKDRIETAVEFINSL